MSREQWTKVRAEWRTNRRLRMVTLVALAVLVLHGLSGLDERTRGDMQRYAGDLELQARLDGLRVQDEWTARADEADAALGAMRERVPEVTGAGMAQAELQAWLTELAASNGLPDPRVRVEDTLDVPGHPELWQVLARLDGAIPQYGQGAFLRALSDALPWIQVERIEIGEGTPSRLSVVVRAYYRRASLAPAEAATGTPTDPATTPEAIP